jgi:carbonic anhydrase/acetyltransferase-like protein (isoleucine patch superfamily)
MQPHHPRPCLLASPCSTGLGLDRPEVTFGRDVEILPMTFLYGETVVGNGAVIGPNTRVTDSSIAENAVVDASVVLEARVGPRAKVGPVSYLRAGTVLEADSKAGTCVEIKKSTVGEGSKVPHLSYIGDTTIGKNVNVGAGSITCNYDGEKKHVTRIDDGAIGSDTMLVAPVTIGERLSCGGGAPSRVMCLLVRWRLSALSRSLSTDGPNAGGRAKAKTKSEDPQARGQGTERTRRCPKRVSACWCLPGRVIPSSPKESRGTWASNLAT